MATKGKKITLFLIDGSANGRVLCELSNWSGKAYKIPRNQIKISEERKDLDNTGVYILFGKDDDGTHTAYIGEAENIRQRLFQHLSNEDFWNEAIVFISKDNNLNKAHIKYLENRLYEIAVNANRYSLTNKVKPTKSSISEPDQAEMEEFLDNLKLLVNTLGHKIFEPVLEINNTDTKDYIYTIERKNCIAKGKPTNEGFVIFKDSEIATHLGNSVNGSLIQLRTKLEENGIIQKIDEKVVFKQNYIFSSSSSAATMVLGVSANGRKEWKHHGQSFGELEK